MIGTDKGTRPMGLWPCALIGLLTLVGVPVLAMAQSEVNTIKSLRRGNSEIDRHLTSSRPFGVRNALIVLRIGSQRFTKSRPPEDGSLNTLIFTLTSDQFARTTPGDRVAVQYGDEPGWDFGPLDKRLLDEQAE